MPAEVGGFYWLTSYRNKRIKVLAAAPLTPQRSHAKVGTWQHGHSSEQPIVNRQKLLDSHHQKFTKLFWLIDMQISAEISATRRRTQCHKQTRLSALSSTSPHATVFPSFLTQSALRYTPSTLGEDVSYPLSLPSQLIVEELKTGLPVSRSRITLLPGNEAQENPWNNVTPGRYSHLVNHQERGTHPPPDWLWGSVACTASTR